MTPDHAAKLLGLPDKFSGFTVMNAATSGTTSVHESKCPNCGYGGITLAIRYPSPPNTAGWRAYDRVAILEAMGEAPRVASK